MLPMPRSRKSSDSVSHSRSASRDGACQIVRSLQFAATLQAPATTPGRRAATWTFVALPQSVSRQMSSRGLVSVTGTLNGHEFQAVLQPDGSGGHWLKLSPRLLSAARVEAGNAVALEICPVETEPEPRLPADLRRALAAAPAPARTTWNDITPRARRDWVHWITSGQRAETRTLRIAKTCDMLACGKRRPCCFDRSGIYSRSLRGPRPSGD